MNDKWKDKPHWTIRFNDCGSWEIVTPDGDTLATKGMGVHTIDLHLEMGNLPRFEVCGHLLCE